MGWAGLAVLAPGSGLVYGNKPSYHRAIHRAATGNAAQRTATALLVRVRAGVLGRGPNKSNAGWQSKHMMKISSSTLLSP